MIIDVEFVLGVCIGVFIGYFVVDGKCVGFCILVFVVG